MPILSVISFVLLGQLPAPKASAARTVLLTYHDMVPKRDSKALWFDCTPEELESQLEFLSKKGATFISLSQLRAHLEDGAPIPPKSVAITFADNYEGFFRLAYPILKRRRVPVAMFVHTDYVGNRQGRPKMDWRTLKQLDAEGWVTVASQTRSHPADITKLDDRQIDEEMRGSKKRLEKEFGKRIDFVAYPNGKYDARVAKAAKEAGYRLGFTESQRPAQSAPNLFMVPRYVHTKYLEAANALK